MGIRLGVNHLLGEELVNDELDELFSKDEFPLYKKKLENEEARIEFVTNFLSYGIITEVLCDNHVEDIVINNLKPIYIHHAERGFIATDKKGCYIKDSNNKLVRTYKIEPGIANQQIAKEVLQEQGINSTFFKKHFLQ